MRSSDELEYFSEDDGSTKPMNISQDSGLRALSSGFWTQSSVARQFEASQVALDDSTATPERTATPDDEHNLSSSSLSATSDEELNQPTAKSTRDNDKIRSRSTSVEDEEEEEEEEELGAPSTDKRAKLRAALTSSMGREIHSIANLK